MTRTRAAASLAAAALALSLLPVPPVAAATAVQCPATATFKIVAQHPDAGWGARTNDIVGPIIVNQAVAMGTGRWLLVCTYDVKGAKGLIDKQVSFASCRTSDNAPVSKTGKFVCN